MDAESVGNIIQVIAVVVAVGASIVALYISHRDRVEARRVADADRAHAAQIAAEDRAAALKHGKLLFEYELLYRLSVNMNRGGYGPDEVGLRKERGAEHLATVALLGRDRLPQQWDRAVVFTSDELRERAKDEASDQWVQDRDETAAALVELAREIREETQPPAPR